VGRDYYLCTKKSDRNIGQDTKSIVAVAAAARADSGGNAGPLMAAPGPVGV